MTLVTAHGVGRFGVQTTRIRKWCTLVGLAALGVVGLGVAQQAGDVVAVDQPTQVDQYLAGQQVTVAAAVAGDVVAAGALV